MNPSGSDVASDFASIYKQTLSVLFAPYRPLARGGSKSGGKHDLSKWTYAKLRDTINHVVRRGSPRVVPGGVPPPPEGLPRLEDEEQEEGHRPERRESPKGRHG